MITTLIHNFKRPDGMLRVLLLRNFALCFLALVGFSQLTNAQGGSAEARLRAAVEAMGGEAKLRSIGALRLEGTGHKYALEQSERPEGPWIAEYQKLVELRDLTGNQLRRTVTTQIADYQFTQTTVFSDGVVATALNDGAMAPDAAGGEEWLALAPERLLLTALNASSLRMEPDVVLQGVPHHRIVFNWQDIPVRIYLNKHTDLPTCVELTRPYPYDYFNVWGDVTTRIFYSFWALKPGGIHYPIQWDVQQNDVTQASVFLTKVEFNPTLPADAFTISENVRAAFRDRLNHANEVKLGSPTRPIQEIAKGIIQIPGNFNTAIIQQEDGLIILEAPVSSVYSSAVIAEAHRRFPDLPIKAVITTSDAWPHVGGVREYVAHGIPLYILDLNQPILERLVAVPHRIQPDALALHPRKPIFKVVSSRIVLGQGANRLELYPIRTETGERMLMAYFPEHHLLYASDLAQPFKSGSWVAQYLFELNTAVQREKLVVDRAFAMHMTPFNWTELLSEITRAMSSEKH